MKKILLTLSLASVTLLSVSCQKALDDIQPTGSTLSLEQVQAGARVSEDRAQAGLPGLYAQLTTREGVYASQGDFGYPSFVCRLEHAGDNVVSTTHGYNWFSSELTHQSLQLKTNVAPTWAWISTYKNIKLANDIIKPYKDLKDNPTIRPVLGQARAMRAWDYFLLAQLFAKTYKGNEASPCVPLITEETTSEEYANNPRKTVKEVYEFILKDLDEAIELLQGFRPSAKNMISEAVAYGIRCRVNMVMNNWSAAEADARKAIEVFGAAPFSIEDCSIPNFDDIQTAQNTMWGIIITGEDAVTKSGIANWTSMFTSLCFGSGGYTTLGNAYKLINTRLWDRIPESDIRKEWWTHSMTLKINGQPTQLNTSKLLINAYPNAVGSLSGKLLPYSVVKFAPTNKDLFEKLNADDFILMRVEEMYYNLAEAQAMGGNPAAGRKTLVDFVKMYRDPQYNPNCQSSEEIQNEIYFQKRVEFWGEGISWFDMLRMKKGIDRVNLQTGDDGGYPERCRFNVPAGDPTFVFQIPREEEQSNHAIDGNNNPPFTPPTDQM